MAESVIITRRRLLKLAPAVGLTSVVPVAALTVVESNRERILRLADELVSAVEAEFGEFDAGGAAYPRNYKLVRTTAAVLGLLPAA